MATVKIGRTGVEIRPAPEEWKFKEEHPERAIRPYFVAALLERFLYAEDRTPRLRLNEIEKCLPAADGERERKITRQMARSAINFCKDALGFKFNEFSAKSAGPFSLSSVGGHEFYIGEDPISEERVRKFLSPQRQAKGSRPSGVRWHSLCADVAADVARAQLLMKQGEFTGTNGAGAVIARLKKLCIEPGISHAYKPLIASVSVMLESKRMLLTEDPKRLIEIARSINKELKRWQRAGSVPNVQVRFLEKHALLLEATAKYQEGERNSNCLNEAQELLDGIANYEGGDLINEARAAYLRGTLSKQYAQVKFDEFGKPKPENLSEPQRQQLVTRVGSALDFLADAILLSALAEDYALLSDSCSVAGDLIVTLFLLTQMMEEDSKKNQLAPAGKLLDLSIDMREKGQAPRNSLYQDLYLLRYLREAKIGSSDPRVNAMNFNPFTGVTNAKRYTTLDEYIQVRLAESESVPHLQKLSLLYQATRYFGRMRNQLYLNAFAKRFLDQYFKCKNMKISRTNTSPDKRRTDLCKYAAEEQFWKSLEQQVRQELNSGERMRLRERRAAVVRPSLGVG